MGARGRLVSVAVVSTGGPGQNARTFQQCDCRSGDSKAYPAPGPQSLGRSCQVARCQGGCLSPAHLPRDSSSNSWKVFSENTWSGFVRAPVQVFARAPAPSPPTRKHTARSSGDVSGPRFAEPAGSGPRTELMTVVLTAREELPAGFLNKPGTLWKPYVGAGNGQRKATCVYHSLRKGVLSPTLWAPPCPPASVFSSIN